MRKEMKAASAAEDYRLAKKLKQQIAQIEKEGLPGAGSTAVTSTGGDSKIDELKRQMAAASAAEDYATASRLKKELLELRAKDKEEREQKREERKASKPKVEPKADPKVEEEAPPAVEEEEGASCGADGGVSITEAVFDRLSAAGTFASGVSWDEFARLARRAADAAGVGKKKTKGKKKKAGKGEGKDEGVRAEDAQKGEGSTKEKVKEKAKEKAKGGGAGRSNVAIPGHKTTYSVVTEGAGRAVKNGDKVTVHATGVVIDTGKQFWSTRDKGQQPFTYSAGRGGVIKGWDQGVLAGGGMLLNEVRRIVIPAKEGYAEGNPAWGIPKGASLDFLIEVTDIK